MPAGRGLDPPPASARRSGQRRARRTVARAFARQHDTLLSGRTRQPLDAKREFTASCRAELERKEEVTTCFGCSLRRAQIQNSCGLERETGLEPATPCLDGRY